MSATTLIAGGFMIFGPVLGYIPQYQTIMQTRKASFSTGTSLVLFLSNILRIFFWVGRRFETTLLVQSIVMIVAQLAMLELCIRVKNEGYGRAKGSSIMASPFSAFWNWDGFLDHVIFLAVYGLGLTLLAAVFIDYEWFVEVLGFLSLGIESTLGIPQLISNYRKQSTEGLSTTLILSWFLGDVFKTFYFVAQSSPMQFILCGTVQIIVDVLIFVQMFTYSRTRA